MESPLIFESISRKLSLHAEHFPMNTTTENSSNQGSSPVAQNSSSYVDDSVLFRQCLLDSMSDGAIFIDAASKIIVWNNKLESLTGLGSKKLLNLQYDPTLLGLEDLVTRSPVGLEKDPVIRSLRTGKVAKGDFAITGRSGREIKVEITASPVISADRNIRGCVVLVHDSSVQLNLQRQLKDLYAFSMLDPLTQVANRAEFERALDEFVHERETSSINCSLIICDIDYFKQVNDNYNHHVGDQALVAFAGLLKKFVRNRDVVARFGGEEFVILCADCDLQSATQRAEEIRVELTRTPMSMLDGKYITASFGVSQLRADDTATDFFVRADTALIRAKEQGRNQVIASDAVDSQAVKSGVPEETLPNGSSWPKLKGSPLISDQFRTRTPVPVLVEKLRGFIIDADAELRTVKTDFASLVVEFEDPNDYARKGRFEVEIDFMEDEEGDDSSKHGRRTYTYMRVTIRLAKRKWFSTNVPELAPDLLAEIRRYFMIQDESDVICKIKPATEHRER